MLKPLNQSDFSARILKDLGMQYANKNSKTKTRHVLIECTKCLISFSTNVNNAKQKGTKTCPSCSSTVHGLRKDLLYKVWQEQRYRCTKTSHKHFHLYGARGITFSDEFLDVEVWYEYVTSLPNARKSTYSIDRIDNDKGYERGNLRWTSKQIQSANTRRIIKTNSSGYRGVYVNGKKYGASITIEGKRPYLGSYKTALEAAKAYDAYVVINNLEHTVNGVDLFNNIKGK